MAFCRIEWCRICDHETHHTDSECNICSERQRRLARAEWVALTPDEKIERLLKRIEKLEQGPMRF